MCFPRYEAYRASEIPWIEEWPHHWRTQRLKIIFELMRRPIREEDQIITAFRNGEVTLRVNRREEGFTNALQEIGYQGVRKNDLVIHAMDAFAGAVGVSDSDGKSTPVYSVCSPRSKQVVSCYYGRLLRYMALSGFINSLAKGIRERSTDFRWSDAGNVLPPVPTWTEQSSIVLFIDHETAKIEGLIEEQRRLIELLKEKRQAVISNAVTKGLNPNVPIKDSGIEWIGDIPSHWELKRLKHIKSPTPNSFVDGPFGSNLKSEHFVEDGEVYVIESNFATQGVLNRESLKKISLEHFERIRRSETTRGDIALEWERPTRSLSSCAQ